MSANDVRHYAKSVKASIRNDVERIGLRARVFQPWLFCDQPLREQRRHYPGKSCASQVASSAKPAEPRAAQPATALPKTMSRY